jgi:VWFA-related protein
MEVVMSTFGLRGGAFAMLALFSPIVASAQVTFRTETNRVLVPVVVRDADGNAVSNLHREDFELLDNGRPQTIVDFTVEETSGKAAEDRSLPGSGTPSAPMMMPDHFVVLLFDDLHLLDPADLAYARRAALKFLDTLQPNDRVALITTAGPGGVDFTSDRDKLRRAVRDLIPGGHAALATMTVEQLTRAVIALFENVVKRMSTLPGQRTMVVISPGFRIQSPAWTCVPETMRVIDHAIRSRIVIGSVDAKGLALQSATTRFWEFQERVTDGTGGTFIRDNNDLDRAVQRLATVPKYIYLLSFSPDALESDGSFHKLTVKVRDGRKLDIRARKGYDAPGGDKLARKPKEAEGTAKTETLRPSEAETKEVAQSLGIAPATTAAAPAPKDDEIITRDEAVTFKVQGNLVEIPVVARDRRGNAVGNLRQEDFRVFDKGKRQEISKFVVQKRSAIGAPAGQSSSTPPSEAESPAAPAPPGRFIAFVFDDLHAQSAEVAQTRAAVQRYLRSSVQPGDRLALLTTSGKVAVDFTDKPDTLNAALVKVIPNPVTPSALRSCLYISYYEAVLIDQQVSLHPFLSDLSRSIPLQTAYYDATQCLPSPDAQSVFDTAVEEVRQAYYNGQQETRAVLTGMKDLVRRMATLPGQRTVVLVSPGFFVAPDQQSLASDLLAQAVRSKVLINTIDARGVWTSSTFDASQRGGPPPATVIAFKDQDGNAAADELMALAEGTGGIVNLDNDFFGGIRKAANAPEYLYVLGFAPQNLKFDGGFHQLKVTVSSSEKVSLQVRRGYWAPKQAEDEMAVSRQEIENAVFSRDEIHNLAVEMHTQVTDSGGQPKLKVMTSVDLKWIHLRKAEDRNRNELTIVAALFDTNGNFVAGTQKLLELRLRDETVSTLQEKPPVVIATEFDVKTGGYLVRLVARDAEGQQITAENAAVQVP